MPTGKGFGSRGGSGSGGGNGSGDGTFSNSNPTPATVGQIGAGSTFNAVPYDEMFLNLLYTITASLSASNPVRRKGSSTAVALSWSVGKKSNPIQSIVVAGQSIPPTGNSQSGVLNVNTVVNANTNYSMTASDGGSSLTRTASVTYLNDRYWGTLNLTGAGAVVGTLQDLIANPPTEAQVKALNSELAANRVQNRNGLNGNGNYPAFAWPSTFGTPTFVIGGLTNSAFTKIWSGVSLTNADGFTENYDLWVANTRYNGVTNLFQIN